MEGKALIQNLFEDYSYAKCATSKTESVLRTQM